MSDLIRRSDAIKDLCDISNNSDMPEDWHKGLSVAISALHRVPSAEITADDVLEYCRPRLLTIVAEEALPSADRPQGEWKSVKASIYSYGYDVECSVCGHRMGSSFGYKFCPNCGARMKGADDE